MHEKPVGLGIGSGGNDGKSAARATLYAFGGSVQNADNRPVLESQATLEAIKFVKALYDEAMAEEVLTWDDSSNNRSMLAGTASLVLNSISITRTAENKQLPIGEQIRLAKAPQGPGHRLAPVNAMRVAGIWTFAANIDGAKQFLVDLIGQHRQAFVESQFSTFPSFPQTVPDLQTLLAHDAQATPPDKYAVLADAGEWTTNVGYPGYTNAAIGEVSNTGVISRMFTQAATGALTPEEALAQANAQVQSIFTTWRERGKI